MPEETITSTQMAHHMSGQAIITAKFHQTGSAWMNGMLLLWNLCFFAVLVQKVAYNAIQGINLYPMDNVVICFPNTKCIQLLNNWGQIGSSIHQVNHYWAVKY